MAESHCELALQTHSLAATVRLVVFTSRPISRLIITRCTLTVYNKYPLSQTVSC